MIGLARAAPRAGQSAQVEQPDEQQRAGDGADDDAGDGAAGDRARAVFRRPVLSRAEVGYWGLDCVLVVGYSES